MTSREDLIVFLQALRDDFAQHPEAWPNRDLSSFLDAMAAWGWDMAGFYANRGEELGAVAPWRVMADLLMAARVYE